MARAFPRIALWFLLLAGVAEATPRRDILRQALEFFEVTVPVAGRATQRFALTVIEVLDPDFFREGDRPFSIFEQDEKLRWELKRRLVAEALRWYAALIQGGPGEPPLSPEFVASLRSEESLFIGRNTILILSDVDDFSQIYAMLRVAKPSTTNLELPSQRRYRGQLRPWLRPEYRRVEGNRVPIYSYRHPEPHFIIMQNGTVYEGDVVELKHYGASLRKDVDLTALLFHLGQELAVFSVSRFLDDGFWLNLPRIPVIITPGLFVAESDTPHVLSLLKSFDFSVHQEFPNAVRPGRTAEVLLGTPQQFGEGFYRHHAGRRHSWQLSEVSLTSRNDHEFVTRLLHESCTDSVYGSLRRLQLEAERKLQAAIRQFGRPL